MQFLQCSFVECSFVYLFFSLRAVCSPLGRIYNIATNVSFVSCSFLRCFRCSFPCVFSLVYIVIVFVRCFICSFNRTVSFRSALKIALELVSISRQRQLQPWIIFFQEFLNNARVCARYLFISFILVRNFLCRFFRGSP